MIKLPNELLVKIFDYLDPNSQRQLGQTCKRYQDLFRNYAVSALRVTDSKRKSTDILNDYPRTTTLSFDNPASDQILSAFLKNPHQRPSKKQKTAIDTSPIKTLNLYDNTIRWVRPAAVFSNLQSLGFLECGLTQTLLGNILKVCGKQLKELTLLGTGNPSNKHFYDLVPVADHCTQLHSLTVGSDRLSEKTLHKILFNNKKIQKLDLSFCERVSGDSIAEYETGLSELTLHGTKVSDATFIKLIKKHGRTLKNLDLSECNLLTQAVVPTIIEHCVRLKVLDVTNNDVDSDDSLSLLTDEMVREIKSKNPSIEICCNEITQT